ncbi:cyclase family protein [Streptomyces sp. NPDC059788]|uniref:cyclase family protein n=1 Tax=Streptomyces sp. NPDC059788 TaxID=3346948 RepID=UPI003661DDCC
MRLVDLSMMITQDPNDPNVRGIERWTHESGPGRIGKVMAEFIGTVAEKQGISPVPVLDQHAFPDGVFMSNEVVTLTVHGGTHLDAPFHYGPTSEGRPAKTIEEVPLAWCCGPGVRLSFRDKGALEVITRDDVERELDRVGHRLRPGDVVLVETGWSERWPDTAYFTEHPALTPEAIELIVDHGVKLIGIDTSGFDLPTRTMVERFVTTGDTKHLWPCHMFGREREYLQIERMAGLDGLPGPTGFTVFCAPVRVAGAGAGWARPFALVEA